MVPLGRFVSLAIAVIEAPPLFIPTINDRSSSVNSFPLPIFVSVWLQWQMRWLCDQYIMYITALHACGAL